MRIILIYGEDTKAAYKKYREVVHQSKQKGFEIIAITSLKQIVGQSLFEDKTVFVIDKAKKVKISDWKWLGGVTAKYKSNLIIYWEGIAPAAILKFLRKDTKKEKFDLPKLIFTFLDSLYPGNTAKSLKLLAEVTENEPIELIFHLLARQMRDLYWAATSPQTMEIHDWRVLKLKKQADNYSIIQLSQLINNLAEIDIKTKTSDSDLKTELDLWLVKNLK